MATNLAINIDLLDKAFRLGGFKTKRETVDKALEEFVQHRRQKDILKFFGKVEFDPAFSYKKERSRS